MTKKVKMYFIQIGLGSIIYISSLFAIQVYELKDWMTCLFFLVSYSIIGYSVFLAVGKNLWKGHLLDENFLILIATVGAFIIKKPQESVMVLLLFQIGNLFETVATRGAHKSIAELMDIRTDTACRKVKDQEIFVDPQELKVGNVVVIRPGEKIPIDAIVRSGKSTIDMKALTGEVIPKAVAEGDKLYSGSINLTGVLEARVARIYNNSIVSKICTLVDYAIEQKADAHTYLSKLIRIYTPIILCMTIAVAVIPPMSFAMGQWTEWFYRSLIFLIIASPSAILVSVPLTFYGGLRAASKQGVLIKGSHYLEMLAKTDTFLFDKTGTLTKGIFEVQEIHSIGMSEEELLRYTALGESYSNHPIAISVRITYGQTIDKKRVKQVKEMLGLGVRAIVDEQKVFIGNAKLMEQEGIPFQRVRGAGTIIHVVVEGKYVGYIRIADSLKTEAKEVIRELKTRYMISCVMLTGDNEGEAKDIANKLNLDDYYFNLLPVDKVRCLEDFLDSQGIQEKVAYVGDGINDAPVLARADVGIAMGGLGSDAAIEAADIILMDDELSKIISAIKISKQTTKVVKENTYYMVIMKVIVVVLATLGYITMWEAVIADIGVMIITIINAIWVAQYSE